MLSFLPSLVVGLIAWLVYAINSFIWLTPIFVFAVFKLIPFEPSRKVINIILDYCATSWIAMNTWIQRLTISTKFDVEGLSDLKRDEWYLVVANHQSWVDIFVLQRILNKKVPFLKFFLKQELKWVPFFGLAWWALDFPFMVRYTKSFLRKYPHLKGKDVETTRKACAKFRYKPVSVMNFVEGTRFTQAKYQRQQSSYQHLLKPKAGGTAFVLGMMGDAIHKMLDVTIYYPSGIPTFWDFISGKVDEVVVRVKVLPIEPDMVGDYDTDKDYRVHMQSRINHLWLQKDELMNELAKQQTKSQ